MEDGRVRELRHDFRRYYSTSYDEVPTGEAVDLIATLPRGSLYRSSLVDFGEMTDEDERAADLIDEMRRIEQFMATGSTEGAPTVTRPRHLRAAAAEAKRAKEARKRIDETEWEEV